MRTIIINTKYLISLLLSFSIVLSLFDYNVGDKLYYLAHEAYLISSSEPVGSIWSSIRADLSLNHQVDSARVQAEIRKLLADKEKLYSILESAAPYLYFIHKETATRSIPAEIALIPVIESEFNPNDHSKKGALGLWQLMPQTARELGIKVKSGYDGRRNVVFSTKAALAYFNDLKTAFKGNWYLAISAYNCGPGTIFSAMRRSGSSDFWSLRLPAETRVYLPRLLAVAAIIKNPEKYGMQLPPINNKPYFAEIKMTKPVPLTKVAKTTGVALNTLHSLNPDYRQEIVLPNKNGTYTLLVPVKAAPQIQNKLPVTQSVLA